MFGFQFCPSVFIWAAVDFFPGIFECKSLKEEGTHSIVKADSSENLNQEYT